MIETVHSDIQRQVVEVVNSWHETFVSLDKHEVFSALYCYDENIGKNFVTSHSMNKPQKEL